MQATLACAIAVLAAACGSAPRPKLSAAQQQAQILRALKQAECLRAHVITNFPDPSLRNGSLDLSLKGTGIDPASPPFLAAARACHLAPRIGGPGPPGGGP